MYKGLTNIILCPMMPNKIFKKSLSISDKLNGHGQTSAEGSSINSPLQRFVRAKKKINQTFDEIFEYLKESRKFVIDCEITEENDRETRKDLRQIDNFVSQVISINEVLHRDHMKVAFFGRTSNGKSTVVNAMLSDRILPAGIGHTTNCFVTVLGAEGNDAYMEDTSSKTPERKSVESLQQLAHALHNQKLDCSSLLKVYWPQSRCPLLKDDVVFVDSPGIDVSPDLDTWIDNHCLDADVFVLVVNSESTINNTEKSFFHKVNAKLSKPNVFILNNRWDASADGDPEMIKLVRQQHEERAKEFLVDELKCVTQSEASDRIFFVSALETLRYRISKKKCKGLPERQPSIDESSEFNDEEYRMGKIARRQEFEDFELKFKECISKSAISTKFNGHSATGIFIAKEMIKSMEKILNSATNQRQSCINDRSDCQKTLDFMSTELETKTEEIKKRILNISEEVELQVTKAMSEEIRRLGHLVGEFDFPFHPHPGFLRNYKTELHSHIEKGLGKNLKARCSAPLIESIEEYKTEMQDEIFSLIPASACSSTISMNPRTNFAVSYELDVPNLCSDFQEDITFKFSLGWSNLITKYISPRNPRLAILLGAQIRRHSMIFPPHHTTTLMKPVPSQVRAKEDLNNDNENTQQKQITSNHGDHDEMVESISRYDEDELTVAVIQGLGSLGSTTAMGIVVAASLFWKAVGWKLIACGGAGYVTIYLYERAMWTNAAKERCFKKQFVEYASEKLKLIVSFTSKGCSHQIQQELSHAFCQLASQVDSAQKKVKDRISELDEEIQRLEEIEAEAKLFRNKASWLESDLSSFIKDFNLSSSRL